MHNFIRNSFGDQYLHEVNGNGFNKYGAHKTISNKFKQHILEEEYIYVFIGTDSGQLPKYLIQEGVPANSEYIFIEPDELYPSIHPAFPHHPQLHLSTQADWAQLAEDLNLSLHIQANCAHLVDSIAINSGYYFPYTEFATRIRREFDAIVSVALKNAELFHFFKAGLLNLADDEHSLSTIIGNHSDDTAIILGAGPSLDQHIHWIKENQEHLYIFAVSRISQKLHDEGITPDYIVTVDSHDYSYEIGKESFQFEEHATLIHSFHANSQLVGQWLGQKVFTGDRYPWNTRNNQDCIAQNGTTVTNVAYDAAVTMEFGTILLAGVDFCHDTNGFTHAQGTGSESVCAPILNRSEAFVTNNRGEEAETTLEFQNAGKDFSIHATAASEKGIKTINLSGAAMHMEEVSYQESDNIKLLSTQKKLTLNSNLASSAFYKSCQKELNKARSELIKLSTLSKEAIQKNKSLFDQHGNKNFKTEKQLEKLEKKLNNNNNPFIPLIKMIGLRNSLRHLRATRKQEDTWTHFEITDSNVAYFKEFNKNTKLLIEVIEASLKRIKSRILELSPTPDNVTALLQQWIEDKHPRRLQQLSSLGLLKAPTPKITTLVTRLEEIEEELNSFTIYPDAANEEKIKGSFPSIITYANKQDITSLQFLHKKLLNQPEADNKALFLSLCEGLLSYLEDNKEQAFKILADLLGQSDRFSEEELEYILAKVSMIALELQDFTNAAVALETLSQTFSPFYTPKYAELLYLTGETEKALNTYEHYINQYPDDLDTIFSLAELQRKEGADEAAQALYQFILNRNSSYRPAIQRLESLLPR